MGAVCAFLLLPRLGYRNVFLFAFIPGIVGAGIVLLVREAGIARREAGVERGRGSKDAGGSSDTDGANGGRGTGGERLGPAPRDRERPAGPAGREVKSLAVSFRALPRRLRLFIIVASIFTLGHFGYAFLLLRARDVGFSDERAILLYVLFYVVYTLGSVPFGMLSDRIGRKPVIAAGYAFFGLISLGLVLISSTAGVAAFFAVYGIFFAMIDGVQRAFVVDLAPAGLRATALGTFHTSIGLAALPGGYIAGTLWDRISPRATFGYGLALSIVSLALLLFVAGGALRKERAS
jgi:predicted MFS family arabinose efflux permease